MEDMKLNYCEKLFAREEATALFESYIQKHPEHYIKNIDGYPYYWDGTLGAWCADVHNRALAGILVLGANKEIVLKWTHTTSGEVLAD